ncbi:MAG: hypothetical protein EXR69_16475 [Myxococcales bacterium]|nr:hypothetical protein [Myxococcales bacterium]
MSSAAADVNTRTHASANANLGRSTKPVAILLAAGGSSRMGSPKGLLDVGGAPLVCRHIDALTAAGLDVLVVIGAHEDHYRATLADSSTSVAVNREWATTGMADSLRIGLGTSASSPRPWAIVQPVDVPPASARTLALLMAAHGDAVPTYLGAPGHPVRLTGGLAPGERLDQRLALAQRVPVDDPDCLLNLNTPADWERWLLVRRTRAVAP